MSLTAAATRGASASLPSLRASSRCAAGRPSRRGACCSFVAPANERTTRGSPFYGRGSSVRALRASSASSAAASAPPSGRGFGIGGDAARSAPPTEGGWKVVDVPLVFVPGMKGTHLAFEDDAAAPSAAIADARPATKRKRAWLTLRHLLNLPPRPDDDPARDLALPLEYDRARQRRGPLVPDGVVDHILEVSVGGNATASRLVDLNFLPFYGHVTRMLGAMEREYRARRRDGRAASAEAPEGGAGIVARAGSLVARTSAWAFANATTAAARERRERLATAHCRPTAVFAYDWRRPLPELGAALHDFVEETFPEQPVQLVAHSMGGLMCFDAMRRHPAKYAPGAVVAGVPFETGIQYLQDLHKGYFTELDRCRQFTPDKQFTMSSHWSFFPITKGRLEDRFVDVTERCRAGEVLEFEADKSSIGKKATFSPAVEGDNAYFDFYDPDEWERLEIGVFSPEYDGVLTDERRQAYKEHMKIQMAAAKTWRQEVLGEGEDDETGYGDASFRLPFVACATDTVPTVNQILRRRRDREAPGPAPREGGGPANAWEYDYVSGRAVPGDGRIDFDKAFPPGFVPHGRVALDSVHAKQMCWEESGGSWGKIYGEVVAQAEEYVERAREEERAAVAAAAAGGTSEMDEAEEFVDRAREEEQAVVAAAAVAGGTSEMDRPRGRQTVKRMARRAKSNMRRRLRRRKLVKIVAVRPKQFSIRRRRRKRAV